MRGVSTYSFACLPFGRGSGEVLIFLKIKKSLPSFIRLHKFIINHSLSFIYHWNQISQVQTETWLQQLPYRCPHFMSGSIHKVSEMLWPIIPRPTGTIQLSIRVLAPSKEVYPKSWNPESFLSWGFACFKERDHSAHNIFVIVAMRLFLMPQSI